MPTKKYKTIRVFIRFTSQLAAETAAKRTLLTSLLETTSLRYPTQTAFSTQLAELYGASFGMNVNKKGDLHADEELFTQAVSFLKEVLFFPNIVQDEFESKNFTIEKSNLIAYMRSIAEDKQAFASLSLQELFFSKSDNQKFPSFGRPEDLEDVTAKELTETYSSMIKEDAVDIFVIGDVEEDQVIEVMRISPWKILSARKSSESL